MITSITIDVPAAKDMQNMFAGYTAVETIKATIASNTCRVCGYP